MPVLSPPRDQYLDRLNIRNKGIERWVLAPRRRHLVQAGIVTLLALVFLAGGIYGFERCDGFFSCSNLEEGVFVVSFILAALLGVSLTVFVIPMGARWAHNNRTAEWEAEFGGRLDALEEQIGTKADVPLETRKVRDLLGATCAGDFLGARLHVRADFWKGASLYAAAPLAVGLFITLLFAWWGDADGQIAFAFVLPAVPFVFAFRSMSKRTRRTADLATQRHLSEIQSAMGQNLELPTPTFAPYARSTKAV